MSMSRVKRRKKATRFRGSHTHGRGFKKKARGKGHRGGVGMAGTGKRADQKKTLILKNEKDYFGKNIPLAGRDPIKIQALDLRKLLDRLETLVEKGKAKKNKDGYDLNLNGYKVLATGDVNIKLKINAKAASKAAFEKVKKAGGEIILSGFGKKE